MILKRFDGLFLRAFDRTVRVVFMGILFCAEDSYPNETKRAELSVQLNLTDRQLQMWFCHRRLKDRKPPAKRQLRDEEVSVPVIGPPPHVLPPPLPPSEMMVGTVGTYGEQLLPYSRRGSGRLSAAPRLSVPEIGRR